MKKILSLIWSFILIFSMSTTALASDISSNANTDVFSYCNSEGEIITISTSRAATTATSKVYVNGILTQQSIADAAAKTINTEIYDQTANSRNVSLAKTGIMNDFSTYTIHAPVSLETIEIESTVVTIASIGEEPVDNTGLTESIYGDGYYLLGSYGGFHYAPGVYGDLFRTYTSTYDGETKYWSWEAGDTISAISAYISLAGGPVSAIIGILVFTVTEQLSYKQSIELATYTFDYDYEVRVYGIPYFTTNRNITYWRIDNVTEGTTDWEEKSFNYGFSMNNYEMVKIGIDYYLESIQ